MQRRFYILLLLALVGSCGLANAQRDIPTIEALAEHNEAGARSVVSLNEDARKAVDTYYANTKEQTSLKGFRVRIYAGNNQRARKSAESAIYAFRSRYQEPVYYTYDNPYFYVACGNFLTHEEAIIFLSDVKEFFPRALIVSVDIPVGNITRRVEASRNLDKSGKEEAIVESIVDEIIAGRQDDLLLRGLRSLAGGTKADTVAYIPDSLLYIPDSLSFMPDSLACVADSLARVNDSLAMVQRRIEQENRAREYDILSRTLEILPGDTLTFDMPLDGEFFGVTILPDSTDMVDPRLQDILIDDQEMPIVQDKQRGKSGEWEYLDQPF